MDRRLPKVLQFRVLSYPQRGHPVKLADGQILADLGGFTVPTLLAQFQRGRHDLVVEQLSLYLLDLLSFS